MSSNNRVELAKSGVRTADWNVPIVNSEGSGCHLVIDITAYTSGGLTVTIQGLDPTSGKKYTILASAALGAVGTTVLKVGRALTAAANLVANDQMPKDINIFFDHTDATPITYSASMSLIQ